jgi:thiamine biosynthesis lipoprotein
LLSLATSSGAERGVLAAPLLSRRYGWFGSFEAMASPCEVHVAGADHETAERVFAAVRAETQRIEQKFSRYRPDNIVNRINTANGEPVTVDEETAGLLNYADRLFELSGGLFDITSGVLRRVWKFDGSSRLPPASAVRDVLRKVGWRRVHWRAPVLTLEPGMEIDFGGIGKEYAVDRVADMLFRLSHKPVMVNYGGDLRALGNDSQYPSWAVGIENPAIEGTAVEVFDLKQGGIATSGDSKRFCVVNGKRLGHILDPRTGWPIAGAPRSVTVIANHCTEAGLLATLSILNGPEAESFLKAQDVAYRCLW